MVTAVALLRWTSSKVKRQIHRTVHPALHFLRYHLARMSLTCRVLRSHQLFHGSSIFKRFALNGNSHSTRHLHACQRPKTNAAIPSQCVSVPIKLGLYPPFGAHTAFSKMSHLNNGQFLRHPC